MPKTKKLKELLKDTIRQYGKKRGTAIGYAIANSRGWRT